MKIVIKTGRKLERAFAQAIELRGRAEWNDSVSAAHCAEQRAKSVALLVQALPRLLSQLMPKDPSSDPPAADHS